MIGLDTDTLLRLTWCWPKASGRWLLPTSQAKPAQWKALQSVHDEAAFAVEDRQTVARAVELFEGSGACGSSDCLVVARHARHGCELTATVDRGLRKLPGVQLM